MSTLARHRNRPIALAALLFCALVLVGTIYAALAPAQASNARTNDPAEGERLFLANCATCHGPNATGTQNGPSLVGVGAAAVEFQVATGRMPMQNNSPQAPAKPPQFNADQISDLAAFVASLGPGPAIPADEQVDPALGDPSNGMALFRTNCAMCHGAIGAGGALSEGKYAPSVLQTTPRHIYEAMLTGPQSMPVFNDANLTPEQKRDIIAFINVQHQGSPGGLDLGSLGPVGEGLWVWIVGIGGLIGMAVWIGAKSS